MARPTPVAIIRPRRAIFRAVAEYAPDFMAALITRMAAADDLPFSPRASIAAPASLLRAINTVFWMLSPLTAVVTVPSAAAPVSSWEVKAT